ncbi:MAG: type IV toxin-antitoxin system AbiEi family antitoxin domain-containing protein [Candidatus Nanopelagicales bacterium]
MGTEAAAALRLGRKSGLLRSRDAVAAGVSRTALSRLAARGDLVWVSRGVYQLPQGPRADPIAILCATHPSVVVCLTSALAMHGLTTQSPLQVWMAIGNRAAVPRIEYPPLQVVRMNEVNLREGVQEENIDGVTVRVTSPARTVADCFKFRSRVGLDVAIEALRSAWESRTVTMDELWQAAGHTRMTNVMRPYLESLV